jgi:heat-inducible transcriptional repressor
MNLNQRQQQILWATVRQYIATAEPVGSKALVEEYNLQVSAATIRNSFTILEKAGLLYQPHTSAGRVPSDSGYRLYVDRLLQTDLAAGKQAEQQLSSQLDWERWSLEALLRGAAQILATLSGYIAIITPPETNHLTVRHLQLVPIEPRQLMVIVVMDSYQSQSLLVDIPSTNDDDDALTTTAELDALSSFLNSQMRGHSISELAGLDWSELHQRFPSYALVIDRLLTFLQRQIGTSKSTQVMMRGFSEVLRQPEFSELEQVKTLLQLLEAEPEQIGQMILTAGDIAGVSSERLSVRIGTENSWEPMHICTLISSTYGQDELSVGSVSLLGPKRMLYENAIPLVRSTADYISEALSGGKI